MRKYIIVMLAAAVMALIITGCSDSKKMTDRQKEAFQELLGSDQSIAGANVKAIELPEEAAKKFPAVKKVFEITAGSRKYYAFAASPRGYRSTIDLFILIDGAQKEVTGIKVLRHDETPEYAGSLTREWFLNRFRNKSAGAYLNRVVLEASQPNDVIQITCATVSSQAVINGVNAAMGTYREVILGEEAPPVPLAVEEFVTEIR
ncbi:MAG: electron transport complex protein RnfG [Pelotomaculum sp. PtaB.Bin013]|uniref:FMN-binding protein n=1 Tax=Pelotomaculum isophthalicicum JI TaxID=947010 RepID=A0A9X4GZQ0_9FIRM|nr:FMN-binding protein [Pelotomaculum isophthalicicum]MDF9409022.1 FMN-binding protein [Pelotomaculum isophthalicicum JI]OPX91359.1 MAG: electron transport complex protein RnfG [Pelotomaculum sp. PtaB.Bin013]